MSAKRTFHETSDDDSDEQELAPCIKWNRNADDDASVRFDLAFLADRCVAHLRDVRRSMRPRTLDELRNYVAVHRLNVLINECSTGVLMDHLASLGAIFLNEDGSVRVGDAEAVSIRHQEHVVLHCLPSHWIGEHRAYEPASDAFAEIAQQVLAALFADGAPSVFASVRDFRAQLSQLCTVERAFGVDDVIAALSAQGVVRASDQRLLHLPSRCISWVNAQNFLD